jgi:hypothetical protein
VPFEPHPQPPCAEPLLVQVGEGLAVAAVVEESGALPPPEAATAIEEGQTVPETTAPSGIGATGQDRPRWRGRGDAARG